MSGWSGLPAVQSLLIESTGTFFLVLTIALAGDYIGIGLVLTVMVYAWGHISGACFNPSVTLGAWINGGITGVQGICYVVFQVLGSAMGAMTAYAIAANGAITFPHPQAEVPQPSFSALVAEAVYTFALVFVVLSTTAKPRFPNVYYGLAIGGTLLAGVEASGAISGGVLNTAVGLSLSFMSTMINSTPFWNTWIYLVGPISGGAIAGYMFKWLNREAVLSATDEVSKGAALYVMEGIGTFYLVLTVSLTSNPLCIGMMLSAMIYCGGHISGAHYNPAITLAVQLRFMPPGSSWGRAAGRVVAQTVAAIAAAAVSYGLSGKVGFPHPSGPHGNLGAVAFEILYTMLLCSVVLNVATPIDKSGTSNEHFGFAIGLTVAAGAFSTLGGSGGVFNPALGTGLLLIDGILGSERVDYMWVYYVAPAMGAALAAMLFKLTHRHNDPVIEVGYDRLPEMT